MKKLIALCLISCATLLQACDSETYQSPTVVTNEVPDEMLSCSDEPDAPNLRTGDNTTDFKNAAIFILDSRSAAQDCRCKLFHVKKLLKPDDEYDTSYCNI